MDNNHKDLETIDLNEPRLAQYMHKAWKKHQNTVYWVNTNLANTIEHYHSLRNTPSLLYPESCSDGNWGSQTRKSIHVTTASTRIEKLSQQEKLNKICMDAGFLSVVENGQYSMAKDNGEQFHAMACREYTLPRNDGSSQPKGWIQGRTPKFGPYWRLQPVMCTAKMEWR